MYEIDFTHPGKIHFIGIGGISMSGFAELLHSMGFTITGSDWHESKITKHLESLGIQVVYGQKEENITKDIDLVVYTAAVKKTNPEYQAAEKLNLPLMERAVMVGQVMKNYSSAIAIAGTHGKTTTTSIASHIFLAANLDPTISVGGILEAIGGNIRIGHSKHFITEACEYTNSFLHFFPTVGMILNIEEDHMDFFHDLSDIRHSFHLFAKRIPEHGTLIINADIENYEEITEGLSCRVITYGLENKDADFTAENITYNDLGCGTFDAVVQGEVKGHFHLSVVGRHNVSNTLACLALASLYGIDDGTVQKALTTFHGADRRFEYKGEKNGFTIIDDYAHHPTEIRATLTAAKNYPHKTLWCAFQPHTYTRTRAFLKDFASALSLADKVILADIYAAREKDPGDISSAAYFIAAGLIVPDSEILIENTGINPTRAGILKVCEDMGGDITLLNERTEGGEKIADILVRTSKLHGTTIEGDIIPTLIDEIPVIAVMAAVAEGTTVIKDAAELKVKETDRIETVTDNLKAMGADVTPTDDGMIIHGGNPLHGTSIHTLLDHRIAMAFSIAALVAEGNTKILDSKCVDVSYPTFYDTFEALL